MLLLSDITNILCSGLVQISTSLPRKYSNSIDLVFKRIEIMFKQLSSIKTDLEKYHKNVESLFNSLNQKESIFPNFRSAIKIFNKSGNFDFGKCTWTQEEDGEHPVEHQILMQSLLAKWKLLLIVTQFCRKFKITFDTPFSFYLNGNNPCGGHPFFFRFELKTTEASLYKCEYRKANCWILSVSWD